MATRSRWLRRQKAGDDEREATASPQAAQSAPPAPERAVPPMPPQADGTTAPAPGPTIRKGVYLSALVYVEGDMPAPEDFMTPASAALKEALAQAFKGDPGGFSMTLKKVEVQNNVEGDDSGQARFQF